MYEDSKRPKITPAFTASDFEACWAGSYTATPSHDLRGCERLGEVGRKLIYGPVGILKVIAGQMSNFEATHVFSFRKP